jgi:hypothetical protein
MLLRDLWMGAIQCKRNGTLMVLIAILFPPVIFMLDYKSTEELMLLPHQEKGFLGKNGSEGIRIFQHTGHLDEYSETASIRTYGSKSRNSITNFFRKKNVDIPTTIQSESVRKPHTDLMEVREKLLQESAAQAKQKNKHDDRKTDRMADARSSQHHIHIDLLEKPLYTSEISISGDHKNYNSSGQTYSYQKAYRHPEISSFVTTKQMLGNWNKFLEFQIAPVTNFYRHTVC